MINVSNDFLTAQSAAVRRVKCKVEQYEEGILQNTFTGEDSIISVDIQRTGLESTVVGYAIAQRLNIHFRDVNKELSFKSRRTKFKVYLGYQLEEGIEYVTFPTFMVSRVNRDEINNELSVTAYDSIYFLENSNFGNLGSWTGNRSIQDFSNRIANYINNSIEEADYSKADYLPFSVTYTSSPFAITTDLRTVINQICEATQSIGFLNCDDILTFVHLKEDNSVDTTITKNFIYNISSKENRRIAAVAYSGSTTQIATESYSGSTQYIRNNNLIDGRGNIQALLQNLLTVIGGLTVCQLDFDFNGNLALEIGDKLEVVLDNETEETVYTYLLNDTIIYNGGLSHNIKWEYEKEEGAEEEFLTFEESLTEQSTRLQTAMKEATDKINGANGGFVTIIDADNDGNPDNIFITDQQITAKDIVLQSGQCVLKNTTNCTSVLRINKNGLGIASGIKAGTSISNYQTAVTGSGVVANAITTGTLSADLVRAGTLSSNNGKTYFDLDNGKIRTETTFSNKLVKTSLESGKLVVSFDDNEAFGMAPIGFADGRLDEGFFYNPDKCDGMSFNYKAGENRFYTIMQMSRWGTNFYRYNTGNIPFLILSLDANGMVCRQPFFCEAEMKTTSSLSLSGKSIPLWIDGNNQLIFGTNLVTTGSSENFKTNINKADINGLQLINNSTIYNYKYKGDKEEYPIKYGLVIERECPEEVIDNSGDAINLYSMTSISWKAIQELTEKIENLEARINELEGGDNNG